MRPHPALAPLAMLYGAGVALKNLAYDRGWRPPARLRWPVVSVGNIAAGGAGKTPFVIELAQLLAEDGLHVDVLSRGYRRESSAAVERVAPDSGDARRYGDEPVLIARNAQVPVYVGVRRRDAGALAERESPEQEGVHLLDDGFQRRQLARAADIVLLHPRDLGGRLLPAGYLREPVASLRRAHFLVLREEDAASEGRLRGLGLSQPIWRVRRALRVTPVQGPVLAFAGIAHPEDFFAGLRAARLDVQRTLALPDHAPLGRETAERIAAEARGMAAVLTTEKDMVRMPPETGAFLRERLPLDACSLHTELLDAAGCIAALRARLSSAR